MNEIEALRESHAKAIEAMEAAERRNEVLKQNQIAIGARIEEMQRQTSLERAFFADLIVRLSRKDD